MSINQALTRTSTAPVVPVDDHICQYETDGRVTPATVVVDGTRIPIINEGIRTEVRKNEAMALTRHSEVHFPAEWDGEDYASVVRALDPDASNVYDPVDVYIRDHVTDNLVLAHRGFVMGVGGGSRGNLERRMTVGDVGQLLSAIPFDARYEQGATAEQIASDVVDKLESFITPTVFDGIDFKSILRTDSAGDVERGITLDEEVRELIADANEELDTDGVPSFSDIGKAVGDFEIPITVGPITVGNPEISDITTPLGTYVKANVATSVFLFTDGFSRLKAFVLGTDKTFHNDEHTLIDALRWVEEKTDGVFYFEPSDKNNVALVYDEALAEKSLNATHLDGDGDIKIYRNNALHEIRPRNSLIAAGQRNRGGKYPVVTVAHEPLLERANEPLVGPMKNYDVQEPIEVVRQAQTDLQRELSNASLGQITSAPCPLAEPYSVVNSRPACGSAIDDTKPFEYEVESVVHYVSAQRPEQDDRRAHETQMRVSIPVRLSEIATVNIEVETASTSDTSNIERIRKIRRLLNPTTELVG